MGKTLIPNLRSNYKEETLEQLRNYQRAVTADPCGWMRRALGIKLWSRQREITKAIFDPDTPFVTVRSANAVGKSYLAASLTIAHLHAFCPGYVITTGSSWKGIEKILWANIRKTINSAPYDVSLGIRPLETQWKLGDMWGAFGVSSDEPENFGGFRTGVGTFVIVDEASSLDHKTMDAIHGLCNTKGSKILLIGNPLRPEGPFYDTFTDPAWKKFSISASDTPNITGEDNGIEGLATKKWIKERAVAWGKDSPAYKARVLGEFPETGEDNLIPHNWQAKFVTEKRAKPGTLILGLDVARFGTDRTVYLIRDDKQIINIITTTKKSTMDTVGRLLDLKKKYGIDEENIYVDDCGVGGGVTDRLEELDIIINAVNFGERANDTERYSNCRSEAHWIMREALSPENKKRLRIHKRWSSLLQELHLPRYGYSSRGQIKIEPKELIKKRLKKSPDVSDALALTFSATASNFKVEVA